MFVLPAMLLKGLHWGYTRFYLMRFQQPYLTDDEKLQRFDKADERREMLSTPQYVKVDLPEGEESALCPVAPFLRLFGLHKGKPSNHPSAQTKDEIVAEVTAATKVKMQ